MNFSSKGTSQLICLFACFALASCSQATIAPVPATATQLAEQSNQSIGAMEVQAALLSTMAKSYLFVSTTETRLRRAESARLSASQMRKGTRAGLCVEGMGCRIYAGR